MPGPARRRPLRPPRGTALLQALLLAGLLAGCGAPAPGPPSESVPRPSDSPAPVSAGDPDAGPIDFPRLALVRGAQPDAVARLEERLERADAADDPAARLETLVALALLHRAGRDLDAAEEHVARAREAARLTEGRSAPANLFAWLDYAGAAVALDRNRPGPAADLAGSARAGFLRAGDHRGLIEATALLITVHGMYQARFEEAYALVDRCLEHADASPAADREIARLRCLNARASLAYNLADYETAVDDYALLTAPGSPLPERLQASARLNLALCRVHLGHYGSARLAIEQAIAAARTPGRTEYPVSVPTYYRGYLQSRLGDAEAALADYRAALAMFRGEKNSYFESFVLIDIGDILLRQGRPEQAIEEYERSRDIYREAGNPRGLMLVEEGVGRALLDLGDRPGAEERLRRALELAEQVGDRHGWARIAAVLGDGLLRATNPDEAEALLRRGVQVSAESGLLEEQFRATLGLARARRDRGRRGEALEAYRAALSLLDRIRDELRSESQHLTFSESRHVAYREAVDLVLEGTPGPAAVSEAFGIAERARARALLEVMQQARMAGGHRPDGRRRERLMILARIARAQSRLLSRTPDGGGGTAAGGDPAPALRDLEQARADLERFDLEEAVRLPAAARPEPLGLDAVRGRIDDPQTTMAVYWLAPRRSWLWRIDRDGAALVPLGDYDEIVSALDDYRRAIGSEPGWHNPIGAWREPARRLGRLLRIEALSGARGERTLLVVPDGPLLGVPLEPLVVERGRAEPGEAPAGREALAVDEALLGDEARLVYLPSASFLAQEVRHDRDAAGRPSLFAMGDPAGAGAAVTAMAAASAGAVPLPGARSEVRRIAALFGPGRATIRLGPRASKGELRDPAAASADILHIAARAVVPGERPALAGIALAGGGTAGDDGFLRLDEIAALDLNARLAVLSACGTGLGRPVAGEGLQGLARAFLIAGVPAVVPSQWDVSDRATAELMERFYRELLAGRAAPAALASAARGLRRDSLPMYSHPYYWAPFIYFGLPPRAAAG